MIYFSRNNGDARRESILVLSAGIVGLYESLNNEDEDTIIWISQLSKGTELNIYREPDNSNNQWAVSVYAEEHRLGYIAPEKCESVARLMDYGKVFHVYVGDGVELSCFDPDDEIKKIAPDEDYTIPIDIYMDM